MTSEQERAEVEAAWECITIQRRDPERDDMGWHCYGSIAAMGPTEEAVIHDLYAQTVERRRKIAEVEAEIEYIGRQVSMNIGEMAIRSRIVAAEQARLAELKQGWKGASDGN